MRYIYMMLLALAGTAEVWGAENQLHVNQPSDREILLEREFAAPVHAVFDALTQPEQVVRWLKPPAHMKLVDYQVDLRPGGSSRHIFERPSGKRIEVRGEYRIVEPPRRLVYLESYDFSPLQILVTTTLHASPAGTRFEQTLTYASKRERDADLGNVAPSAAAAYDELDRYLRSL